MWDQYRTQDRLNILCEELLYFHDFVIVILVLILSVVAVSMVGRFFGGYINKNLLQGQLIECI